MQARMKFPRKQKERLIAVSLNTFKYRPFSFSDMTTYGTTDDVLLYWDSELDSRKLNTPALNETIDIFTKARIGEVRIVTDFLKNVGYEPEMTIIGWWRALRDCFIIVDQISLDVFWYKYTIHTEHKLMTYDAMLSNRQITFSDWLNMYANLDNMIEPDEEAIMSKPLGSIIKHA